MYLRKSQSSLQCCLLNLYYLNYLSSVISEQSHCTRDAHTCTWSTRILPHHRDKNLGKYLPPKFSNCPTNEKTSPSSPISCLFYSHVFCLENWDLLKDYWPPYLSDMSGNHLLWFVLPHAPTVHLFGQNKRKNLSFIRTFSLSKQRSEQTSLSRNQQPYVFKLQKPFLFFDFIRRNH